MDKMKAARIHAYGGPEVLRYEDAPKPAPGSGEALVRVHATSVNQFDWKVRRGYLAGYFNHTLPLIIGWDVSGVVEAVGEGVTSLAPGDAVFGQADITRDGAYAEYVSVNAGLLVRKPEAVSHAAAAALPLAGNAAWRCVMGNGNVKEGQTVLIHGAAGGVGSFAVQLAKRRGARVIGTASANHLDFLRELGADEVVDYNVTRFEEAVPEADLVIDTIGGETQQRSWKICKSGGMMLSLVEAPSAEEGAARGVRHELIAAYPDPGILAELAALASAGALRPVISATLQLAEAQEGHILSEGLHTRGKIVLQVVTNGRLSQP
jgi:NADPH:quinone reductase-like Zn-dependent oxidoreductase